MRCLGLAQSGCSALLAKVRMVESTVALFSRFGTTGTMVALMLMLVHALAEPLVETLRAYLHGSVGMNPVRREL